MTTIYNATPHNINFFSKDAVEFDAAQRKYIADGLPLYTLAKGNPVNCQTSVVITTIQQIEYRRGMKKKI